MRTEDQSLRYLWDERLGMQPGYVERIIHGHPAWRDVQMGRLEPSIYWDAVAQDLGLSPDLLLSLQQEFFRHDRLDDQLIRLIRSLRADGVRVGLLSNNSLALLDEITQLGLSDLFDEAVISAQIGVMKPDPAAYYAVLAALDVRPEQSAFVDDFAENVEGARAVGMYGILFHPDLNLTIALRDWLHGNA